MTRAILWGTILLMGISMIACENTDSEDADNKMNGYDEIVQVIDGTTQELIFGDIVLSELPASFDLNPRLTRMRENPQWPFHIYKQISVTVSRYPWHGDEIIVRITPSINMIKNVEVAIFWKRIDAIKRGVTKEYQSKTLFSKKRSDFSIFLLNQEGQEETDITNDWVLMIALRGKNGVICWNSQGNDEVIAPHTSGFRRFRIQGAADSQGWRLLEPLIAGE